LITLLLSLMSAAQAAPELEAGGYTGLVFVGPNHELYDSAGGAEWKKMGPAIPLGLRGAIYPVDFFGIEGELHAGPSPIRDAGVGLLGSSRLHAIGRLGPMGGDLGLRPHLAAGGGSWGVRSSADALGKDTDRAFYVGPGARMDLTDTIALRADLRYLFVARKGTGASEFGGSTELLVGLTLHKAPPPPPIDPATLDDDGDSILNGVDACPTEAEVVNNFKDDDGCPDSLGKVELLIVDFEGAPVPGAKVMLDGKELGVTGPNGTVAIAGELMPGTKLEVSATHPGAGRGKATFEVGEGVQQPKLAMEQILGKLSVSAQTSKGDPLDATIKATGVPKFYPVQLGADGTEAFPIATGDWQVFISAEGFGTERREVSIREGELTDLGVIFLVPSRAIVAKTQVEVKEKILFETNGFDIKAESNSLLDAIATLLIEHPELLKIEVGGHTDDRGNDAYNLELSQKRVDSVVAALVKRGVPANRLVAKGYGETVPVGDNKTTAGREANRRVEFNILEREQ
jgi:outer membrane protein OmpA-like peptidoglycan-associated protein